MQKSTQRALLIWLFSGCFLVFMMVVVGGITRLTRSGLSITEWNPIMGAIPPLNEADWQIAFAKYQQTPEFQKINFDMQLEEFKFIFFWEFIHRLIGRLIGIVFLIPFLYFYLTKKIDKPFALKLLGVFALGGLQGFIGWYMVASGLVDNPHVSHYRLATHLITAFITFGYIFWLALEVMYPNSKGEKTPIALKSMSRLVLGVVTLQIIYGAFVAGLKAGHIYNTFPKMGDEWFPEAITAIEPWYSNFTEGLAGVQFVHRYIAYVVVGLFIALWYRTKNMGLSSYQQNGIKALGIALGVQFLLGLFTLLYSVPITLGVLHQVGAFFLFATSIYLVFHSRNELAQGSV